MELGGSGRARAAADVRLGAAVTECRRLVDQMFRTVRDLALGLRPSMLDDFGLQPALEWHVRAYGLPFPGLRYFTAAGASETRGERHDPETHLIPLVLAAAAGSAPPITVFGRDYPTRDGTCVRDYIHVLDLAQAHVQVLEGLAEGRVTVAGGHIYNLGCGGRGYTVQEVIDTAAAVVGRPIPVSEGGRRPGDPAMLVASSGRIQHDIGWAPRFDDLGLIIDSAWRFMMERRGRPGV